MINTILDLHHNDGRYDLRVSGMVALIHKATEGKDWRDPRFAAALTEARNCGMLVGAYHFGSASSTGAVQADFFLGEVRPQGEDVLRVLDLENNPGSSGTMTTAQAADFVARVHEVTGRWPVLYAGAYDLRGRWKVSTPEQRATLARCPLWLAQYGEPPTPRSYPSGPDGWPSGWSLWQYTNGTAGPSDQRTYPRTVPGFRDPTQDRSVFRGTVDELRAWWASAGRPRCA